MSLREDILALDDSRVIALEIPEWQRSVFLRVISGAERDRFEESCQPNQKTGQRSMANFRARFAVLVLSDDKGKRLFTDADAGELGKKSQGSLDRILEAGGALNGMNAKDVDDLEKKSAIDPSVGSGSV